MTSAAWFAAPAPTRRPPFARLGPLTEPSLLATVLVLFAVSGGMLWLVGYNYDGLSGGSLTKIHPFTYMIVALFGWSVLISGDPVGRTVHLANQRPASLLMALTTVALLILFVLREGSGLAGLLDTFLGASLLVMLLSDADERLMARLETLLHAVMTVNALMGLGEFATKKLLFPYRFDGAVFETDTRSSALQGHPLVNATMTACYLMALLTGGRSLSSGLKFAFIGLQAAALVVFGGRTALLCSLAFGGSYGIVALLRQLRSGRVPLLGAAAGVVLLTLAPVAIGALWAAGFFDALIVRFISDGGSANARKEMFELIYALPLRDLIVGPDIAWVDTLRRVNGLEWGIENPFIRMTLYQGAVVTFIVTVVFGLFTYEIARQCHRGIWLPMVVWLILLNGAESIASKTTMPAKFAIILLCMYRKPRPAGTERIGGIEHPGVSSREC